MNEAWVHRLALLTAWATLPLLILGGLVTTTGSALAVPDWPTTFGYNMFLFPWSKMSGGILYEHSHRLAGSLVGVLTILLALAIWIWEPRRWLRWLALGALTLVCVQGVIGGLRVVLLERMLAIVHAGLAQAFFATAVALAVLTSKGTNKFGESPSPPVENGRLPLLSAATTLVILAQVLLGAVLRHTGTVLLPHIAGAMLVTALVIILGVRIRDAADSPKFLIRPWAMLTALLICQLLLGAGAYAVMFTQAGAQLPAVAAVAFRTSHVVAGGLMLANSMVLTLRAYGGQSFWNSTSVQTLGSERVSA